MRLQIIMGRILKVVFKRFRKRIGENTIIISWRLNQERFMCYIIGVINLKTQEYYTKQKIRNKTMRIIDSSFGFRFQAV